MYTCKRWNVSSNLSTRRACVHVNGDRIAWIRHYWHQFVYIRIYVFGSLYLSSEVCDFLSLYLYIGSEPRYVYVCVSYPNGNFGPYSLYIFSLCPQLYSFHINICCSKNFKVYMNMWSSSLKKEIERGDAKTNGYMKELLYRKYQMTWL